MKSISSAVGSRYLSFLVEITYCACWTLVLFYSEKGNVRIVYNYYSKLRGYDKLLKIPVKTVLMEHVSLDKGNNKNKATKINSREISSPLGTFNYHKSYYL